jgi:hypothetical protein
MIPLYRVKYLGLVCLGMLDVFYKVGHAGGMLDALPMTKHE